MENQIFWKAKAAIICYITLFAGILFGSIIIAFVLLGTGNSLNELNFPSAIIVLPVNEGLILGITLFFAKRQGATLQHLGLRKPNLKILLIGVLAALFLIFLAGGFSLIEEFFLGPDPDAEFLIRAILPNNNLQLILLIGISLFLVGPSEELAFRGFIQRGFENSFGKINGLLIASLLFGLLHGLNSYYSILPVTVVSLFLGYIWQKTGGNTTATAWIHGIYDAIAIAIAYFTII
jgi:membrane protease YdiL (CAAX protease family)